MEPPRPEAIGLIKQLPTILGKPITPVGKPFVLLSSLGPPHASLGRQAFEEDFVGFFEEAAAPLMGLELADDAEGLPLPRGVEPAFDENMLLPADLGLALPLPLPLALSILLRLLGWLLMAADTLALLTVMQRTTVKSFASTTLMSPVEPPQ